MTLTAALSAEQVLDAIAAGHCDDQLDDVKFAVKDRQTILARRKFRTIKAGDRGRLQNLRPKYLVGAPVTVVRPNQTRLVVRIDDEYLDAHGISRFHGEITVQVDMLDVD